MALIAVRRDHKYHPICAGVIVSPQWILTVEICLHDLNPAAKSDNLPTTTTTTTVKPTTPANIKRKISDDNTDNQTTIVIEPRAFNATDPAKKIKSIEDVVVQVGNSQAMTNTDEWWSEVVEVKFPQKSEPLLALLKVCKSSRNN